MKIIADLRSNDIHRLITQRYTNSPTSFGHDSVGQSRASILDFFERYNDERPHSGLNRKRRIRLIWIGCQPLSWPPKPWQGFNFKFRIRCSS
ncbi:integrase core domain-containing protein [Methylomonas aurea]|uniref:integrase core domain-containing protein n=1 Tax=Methylomonas aurea TaxID=2952224 RepID=UPI003531FA52